jgi:hypothetical protein
MQLAEYGYYAGHRLSTYEEDHLISRDELPNPAPVVSFPVLARD